MSKPMHFFVGWMPCGCAVAVSVDDGRGDETDEMKSHGYHIERLTADQYRKIKLGHTCRRLLVPAPLADRKFQPHPTDPEIIVGQWHEDDSAYDIRVPHQLRDSFLSLLERACSPVANRGGDGEGT